MAKISNKKDKSISQVKYYTWYKKKHDINQYLE